MHAALLHLGVNLVSTPASIKFRPPQRQDSRHLPIVGVSIDQSRTGRPLFQCLSFQTRYSAHSWYQRGRHGSSHGPRNLPFSTDRPHGSPEVSGI